MTAKSELLTGTVVPPASRNAAPRATPNMPSVPMKGGTLRRETSRPLMMPGTQATRTPQMKPTSTPPASPSAGVTALIVCAATTAARPMMKPSDRSMPPEMMTKVWPVASRSGATAKIAIDCRLKGLSMNVPPKADARPGLEDDDQRRRGTATPGGRRCAG